MQGIKKREWWSLQLVGGIFQFPSASLWINSVDLRRCSIVSLSISLTAWLVSIPPYSSISSIAVHDTDLSCGSERTEVFVSQTKFLIRVEKHIGVSIFRWPKEIDWSIVVSIVWNTHFMYLKKKTPKKLVWTHRPFYLFTTCLAIHLNLWYGS